MCVLTIEIIVVPLHLAAQYSPTWRAQLSYLPYSGKGVGLAAHLHPATNQVSYFGKLPAPLALCQTKDLCREMGEWV